MEYDIGVGASREQLRKMANELLAACDQPHVDITFYCEGNASTVKEVRLAFNNDDMENREDLAPETVLVDVESV